MKVLVIGQGGREHAIAWKAAQSPHVTAVYCAPGNPGISACAEIVAIASDNISAIGDFAVKQKIDLTIVGPELPLSLGLVDHLRALGCAVFGPTKAAALLEASKNFSKEVMRAAGVPTAANSLARSRDEALVALNQQGTPLVFKADGLAAGKGVFVAHSREEALRAIDSLYRDQQDATVLIEQFLAGREASLIVATDGERIVPLAPSNDYKRIGDNDSGDNTGGMGTVSPTQHLSNAQFNEAVERVIKPVIREMACRGTPFSGFLYAGLMIGDKGEINCLEFNARLGDPETQVIMRRLTSDLVPLLYGLATGAAVTDPEWSTETAVCVVQAAAGYPADVRKGDIIRGIDQAAQLENVVVFHAGTAIDKSGHLVTAGGRVLNVTAVGSSLDSARQRAYDACKQISFSGQQYRSDIGLVRPRA